MKEREAAIEPLLPLRLKASPPCFWRSAGERPPIYSDLRLRSSFGQEPKV
jgi:hypothetical protein